LPIKNLFHKLCSADGERDALRKKKLTLTFEEYKTLSTMLIVHMRNEEIRAEREGKFSSHGGTSNHIWLLVL
jgi:hypothetical protein